MTTTLLNPVSRTAAPAAAPAPRLVEPLGHPGWDAAVARLPGATVFHQTPWLRLVRETYGHLPLAWISGPAESPSAALIVVEVTSPLTGRRGVGEGLDQPGGGRGGGRPGNGVHERRGHAGNSCRRKVGR